MLQLGQLHNNECDATLNTSACCYDCLACLMYHGISQKEQKILFLEYVFMDHLDLDVEELKEEVANEREITYRPPY